MTATSPILQQVHRATLMEIDRGHSRYPASYPPALALVEAGYCEWHRGNPQSWKLDLTELGQAAVDYINDPEGLHDLRLDRVRENVYRIVHGDDVKGYAARNAQGYWTAYDGDSVRISEEKFSSPAAIVVMMKMVEAEITMSCRDAIVADMRPASPRF